MFLFSVFPVCRVLTLLSLCPVTSTSCHSLFPLCPVVLSDLCVLSSFVSSMFYHNFAISNSRLLYILSYFCSLYVLSLSLFLLCHVILCSIYVLSFFVPSMSHSAMVMSITDMCLHYHKVYFISRDSHFFYCLLDCSALFLRKVPLTFVSLTNTTTFSNCYVTFPHLSHITFPGIPPVFVPK